MPFRILVTQQMSELFGVLAHPHRIRIVEELRDGEKDVNTLTRILGISHAGVSQHLTLLRAHKLVYERRQGRHVFYRLRQPQLATWLIEGLQFITPDAETVEQMRSAVEKAREAWS